jgi:hypothetical protein
MLYLNLLQSLMVEVQVLALHLLNDDTVENGDAPVHTGKLSIIKAAASIMWRTLVVRRGLSIHNYMKGYQQEMVARRHGRMRVDEYCQLKDSKRQLNRLEKE